MPSRTRIPNDDLQKLARMFHYPPTPDLAKAAAQSLRNAGRQKVRVRIAWASALLALLIIVFAVPPVRAQIIEFFQIGVVRVFPPHPQPVTATPSGLIPSETPQAFIPALADLAGETTLEDARQQAGFPIRLPAYPADLGAPQRVFLQADGPMVILVWFKPDDRVNPYLSLYEIAPGAITLKKTEPKVIQQTKVNGANALWVEGPYLMMTSDRNFVFRRIVEGNTLVWEIGDITYRLESGLSLEQALRMAESIK